MADENNKDSEIKWKQNADDVFWQQNDNDETLRKLQWQNIYWDLKPFILEANFPSSWVP